MPVSPGLATQLAELESSNVSQSVKSSRYSSLLESMLDVNSKDKSNDLVSDLPAYINSLLLESNLGIVSARPLLNTTATAISKVSSADEKIEICTAALSALRDKASTFEEANISLRQTLAAAYRATDAFIDAAKTLEGIPMESSTTKVSDTAKVNHWITICRLYIEDDDMLSAETFLNKAKTLRWGISEPELLLNFQLCNARILDSKREFLDSSIAYYAVSTSAALADEDRAAALTQAITTAILAPAGPPRSKFLGRLFAHDRTTTLGDPLYPILRKMHLSLLVAPAEISAFAATLAPHQLAKTADGSTVLAKAMVEHNLLAASRLYSNIDLVSLGELLGLERERAEDVAARMLEQGRMKGTIDQIEGWLVFADESDDGGAAHGQTQGTGHGHGQGHGMATGMGLSQIGRYDRTVARVVEDVERVASLVAASS